MSQKSSSAPIALSVVVPTLNRSSLLEQTLRLIAPQIEAMQDSAELIVSDNASDDKTATVVEALREVYPNIRYHHFPDRVEIDDSFKRSAALCRGEFIWVLGDDDFPLYGALQFLIHKIRHHDACKFFHFERLVANPAMTQGNFSFQVQNLGNETMSGQDLVERVLLRPGFISSFVAHSSLWEAPFEMKPFAGYGFLAMLYSRIFDETCMLVGEPLAIQRSSDSVWKGQWPRYLLLSQPRILTSLPFEEDRKVSIMKKWQRYYCRPIPFIYNCVFAKGAGFMDSSDWPEALTFQPKRNRYISQLIGLIPSGLCRAFVTWYLSRKHNL